MRPMRVFIAAFAISALSSAFPQSTDALPSDNQHYGDIADPSVWPISAVGVVTVALFSRKIYCTGTLVAPKLVLTAAHCLFNGKLLVNSGNVRFLAGLNKGVPAAHADAKRLVIPKEFSPGPPTQETVVNDWAVIVLSDALSTKPTCTADNARRTPPCQSGRNYANRLRKRSALSAFHRSRLRGE
jgi:secreted trypsin-like serine protease